MNKKLVFPAIALAGMMSINGCNNSNGLESGSNGLESTKITQQIDVTKENIEQVLLKIKSVDSYPCYSEKVANLEEKTFFMDFYPKLKAAILKADSKKLKNIKIIKTPESKEKPKKIYYDIWINLDRPIEIRGITYSTIYLNVVPSNDLILGGFQKNSNEKFPYLRFTANGLNGTSLCYSERYYDNNTYDFQEKVWKGVYVDVNYGDLELLINRFIKELNK